MATHYAITDPHGCLDVLGRALGTLDLTGENHLYLLGDYIPHQTASMGEREYLRRCEESLSFVRGFWQEHRGHVTTLLGNHELYLLGCEERGEIEIGPRLLTWLKRLKWYAETERQVFVHAGVDEEAGRAWKYAPDPWDFCLRYPPTFGRFRKNVVAGHVGVTTLAQDPSFEGVFWDGASHYYLDQTTERSGRLAVLSFDTERNDYRQWLVTANGASDPMPIVAAL